MKKELKTNYSDQKRSEKLPRNYPENYPEADRAQQGHNKILSPMAENPQISISALAKQCEVSEKAMRITQERMKAENVIKRIGPDKGGY